MAKSVLSIMVVNVAAPRVLQSVPFAISVDDRVLTEPRHEKTGINRAVQPQKMTRGLKFRI